MFDQSCHVAHRHDQNHNQYNHLNRQHHDDEHNNEDDEDDRTVSTAKAPNDEPCFVVWAQVFFKNIYSNTTNDYLQALYSTLQLRKGSRHREKKGDDR